MLQYSIDNEHMFCFFCYKNQLQDSFSLYHIFYLAPFKFGLEEEGKISNNIELASLILLVCIGNSLVYVGVWGWSF